jgi:alkaline phosphatase D
MDAYFELLPIDAEGPAYVLWRSFRWGLTAEILVLDCRYERKPSQGLYMSAEQMDWIKQRLQDSPCHFKIIMNSVPITNMPFVWDVAANDRWEGYPASRNELLSFISQNRIDNVWFISGDFHVCFVSQLEPTPSDFASTLREIAVTGGNTNLLGSGLGGAQFAYGTSSARALLVTLDPQANAVNVRFVDPATGQDDYNESLTYS